MADFRQDLYRRYVSTFKGPASSWDRSTRAAYGRWCRYAYGPILREVGSDEPVLELGCGAGYMLEFLRDSGFDQALGIDVSEEQIALAKERGLAASVAEAGDFLKSHPEAYGVILAIDFLEHFTKDELLSLLPAIHRALKEDGRLIVQTPNGQALFGGQVIHGDLTHMTILNPGSLSQLLQITGFTDIQMRETNPFPIGWRGRARCILWWIVKMFANAIRRIESGKTQSIWTENMICTCRKQSIRSAPSA